jgi:Tol biopolymer transport system component
MDQAMFTGVQIAEALEAAHAQGVVHRDLKPANIIIAPDGKAKVLDFGLAKSYETEGSGSGPSATQNPTMTTGGTRAGVILGTAAYMSPEQARGKPMDKRTDIWSFGCVLFECLTANGPYKGETVSDSLGAILHKEPDYDLLPDDTPPTLRLLLRRCLAKNARKRLHDIADARIELEQAIEDPQGSLAGLSREAVAAADAKYAQKTGRVRKRFAAAGIVIGLLVGLLGGWMLRGEPEAAPVLKLDLGVTIDTTDPRRQFAAISPDDSRIVFTNQDQLWVQLLNELEPRMLDGTENAIAPFWSPDGEWIGYFASRKLWKMPATGGRPVAICELGDETSGGVGASWSDDDTIVFARGNSGLMQVSALGGQPREIVPVEDGIGDLHEPFALPDGRGILYVVHRDSTSPGELVVRHGDEVRILVEQSAQERIWFPVYADTGHILFRRSGGQTTEGLWAVSFDLGSLETSGDPFLVAPDAGSGSVSRDGGLAFIHNPPGATNDQMVWVDRAGRVLEPASNLFDGVGAPSLSPDGKRLAFTAGSPEAADAWVRDLERGAETRLTSNDTFSFDYHWHRTGDLIYTVFDRGDGGGLPRGLFTHRVPSDGSALPVELGPGMIGGLTPDGSRMVVTRAQEGDPEKMFGDAKADIWLVALDGTEERVLVQGPANEKAGPISPDGRFMAYISDSSGKDEVYLTRFPEGTGRWQVSLAGGNLPHWGPDGKSLYFVNGAELLQVSFEAGATPVLGRPTLQFEGDDEMLDRGFSIAPDGQRIVLGQHAREEGDEEPRRTGIKIVRNWHREFE